jgi:hypothetical protein
MRNYYFLIFFIGLGLSACKQQVYLTVTEPPAVHLIKEYTRGGIINRTFSEGGSKVIDDIDNALTLEGDIDRTGSNKAVRGAFDLLTTDQRFESLSILDSLTVKRGGIDVFPAPLTWNEVDELCRKNEVQFLMVLEMYDTDTRIDYTMGTTTRSTPLGTINVPVHNASLTTLIKTGWRIYDPKNRLIIDEFRINDQIISRGSGINPAVALATILNREQTVIQLSTTIGQFYAGRVQSQNFRVWRNYYTKGSPNLKIARRKVQVGDWDGAAAMWEKDLTNAKRKVAGRAYYNMAIYKEITGNVDGALEYVQKSYSDYNIKEGLRYATILRDRIARREREKVLSGE